MGVYVHIPFCRKKCPYCDFPSHAGREALFEAYKNAVICEIDKSEELSSSTIDTVFFGGGAPTVLPALFLAEILARILKHNVTPDAEITVEGNPGTFNADTLKTLRGAGFNRLSVGAQAWQDRLLKRLGRIHNSDDITRAYDAAEKAGFSNINLDLMFSLPGQTMGDWEETLRKTADLKPAHISAYSLIIEENTEFHRLFNEGKLALPGEDEDRRMYYAASDILGHFGYRQYEISNFSLKGRECGHNLKYWKRRPYIGFGTDSHSFYDNMRWHNTHSLETYLGYANVSEFSREEVQTVSARDAMEETMYLGLRLNDGVTAEEFRRASGSDLFDVFGGVINRMITLGLMNRNGDRVFLTAKGRDVSNYVFSGFLLPP